MANPTGFNEAALFQVRKAGVGACESSGLD